ncbi:MAG: SLOG family protein [Pirellulaceae bacterium]|nr:SLOG family protein [Pirellulaceae bacterium]
MKTIIAGSRSIGRLSPRKWNYEMLVALVEKAVQDSDFQITEVISGGAGGPDRAGEKWAESQSIPVTQIKPNWKLGRGAGLIANKELVEHAEALVVLYDGTSSGTKDTIQRMRQKGAKVFVVTVSCEQPE